MSVLATLYLALGFFLAVRILDHLIATHQIPPGEARGIAALLLVPLVTLLWLPALAWALRPERA